MKEKIITITKEIVPYIIVILVAVLIRTFIVSPVRVNGSSMYDTLKEGQILLLNKMNKNYKRFDIVVIDKNGTKLIKRIIGLPGERIEYKNNSLYINNKFVKDVSKEVTDNFTLEEVTGGYSIIPEGYYFVMGDNRGHSSDSRDPRIGLIKKSEIKGKATFRLWPLNKIGKVK